MSKQNLMDEHAQRASIRSRDVEQHIEQNATRDKAIAGLRCIPPHRSPATLTSVLRKDGQTEDHE
jgi:hypothetical protein